MRLLTASLLITAAACGNKPAAPTTAPVITGGRCDLLGHYTVNLAWQPGDECSLRPQSLTTVGFIVTQEESGMEVMLDDGVQKQDASPYYDSIEVEKSDGCAITIKLTQPPSHQVWAFLTLDLTQSGTTLAGTAAYEQSDEGETCSATATITGSR